MTVAVLVKAVPDLDTLAYNPSDRTVIRSDTRLFLNPFDLRAVLLGTSLRRAGEDVLAVSMGPPAALPALREALALGADRAWLLSDPAFAGSDTLATARVLAAALRDLPAELVLTGRSSTDSSTGQVPAQVAELLELPMVGAARSVARTQDGRLRVSAETEEGSSEFEVRPPALVSVGEKVVRVRKPTPEALLEAEGKPLLTRGRADVVPHLSSHELGLLGSPTRVMGLENESPPRTPMILRDGAPVARARVAAALIRERLRAPRPSTPPPRSVQPIPTDDGEVLVFVSGEEGGLDRDALPLVHAILRLPPPFWPSVAGFGTLKIDEQEALGSAGAVRAYWNATQTGPVDAPVAVSLIRSVLRSRPRAAAALLLASAFGREVGGRLSSRLGLGLIGDSIGIEWDTVHGMVFRKPSFGGGLVAQVTSRLRPALATIRPGALPDDGLGKAGASPEVRRAPEQVLIEATSPPVRVVRTGRHVERDPRFGRLEGAPCVVAIGMGVGGPEQLPRLLEVVRPLGAAIGATRRVVDAGWVPTQLQIGLTGRSLAPDLYIGVGVSGKANHLVGVKRARVLVGINPLESEPLFQRVDVGLVGSWEELLPPLVRELTSGP